MFQWDYLNIEMENYISRYKILNNTEVWGMFPMADNKLLIATIDKDYSSMTIKTASMGKQKFIIKKNSCLGGTAINKKRLHLILF
jgi:hypothetical protein